MTMVDASPFSALLTLFFVVPLAILIAIYGGEGAVALRHRGWRRSRRP